MSTQAASLQAIGLRRLAAARRAPTHAVCGRTPAPAPLPAPRVPLLHAPAAPATQSARRSSVRTMATSPFQGARCGS
jgi:hypothetical protein